MSWSGPMNVNVYNRTGGTISELTASHTWKGSTTSVRPTSLPDGALTNFAIETGSGGSDEWTVTFVYGGKRYYRDGKQCNVDEKDRTSGQSIEIKLQSPESGWTIKMPLSSSCVNIDYDVQD
jgi:hypothetical protein